MSNASESLTRFSEVTVKPNWDQMLEKNSLNIVLRKSLKKDSWKTIEVSNDKIRQMRKKCVFNVQNYTITISFKEFWNSDLNALKT